MVLSGEKPVKVLFVCTGNIFRSMGAEYFLKKHLFTLGDTRFLVSSAGTKAELQEAIITWTVSGTLLLIGFGVLGFVLYLTV